MRALAARAACPWYVIMPIKLTVLAALLLALVLSTQALVPVKDSDDEPELALLMGDLQRLTHKLALSADACNTELAAFYLHESLEQLQKIQTQAPEYEGQPVAVLIDRMARPSYSAMQQAVESKSNDRERLLTALDAIIQNCNACHIATQRPKLRITRGTEVNPFNQSFQP